VTQPPAEEIEESRYPIAQPALCRIGIPCEIHFLTGSHLGIAQGVLTPKDDRDASRDLEDPGGSVKTG
jgi:hypothetical protein